MVWDVWRTARQSTPICALAVLLCIEVAEAGRRGGGGMTTSGSFTMKRGRNGKGGRGNRAGNDEEDLGSVAGDHHIPEPSHVSKLDAHQSDAVGESMLQSGAVFTNPADGSTIECPKGKVCTLECIAKDKPVCTDITVKGEFKRVKCEPLGVGTDQNAGKFKNLACATANFDDMKYVGPLAVGNECKRNFENRKYVRNEPCGPDASGLIHNPPPLSLVLCPHGKSCKVRCDLPPTGKRGGAHVGHGDLCRQSTYIGNFPEMKLKGGAGERIIVNCVGTCSMEFLPDMSSHREGYASGYFKGSFKDLKSSAKGSCSYMNFEKASVENLKFVGQQIGYAWSYSDTSPPWMRDSDDQTWASQTGAMVFGVLKGNVFCDGRGCGLWYINTLGDSKVPTSVVMKNNAGLYGIKYRKMASGAEINLVCDKCSHHYGQNVKETHKFAKPKYIGGPPPTELVPPTVQAFRAIGFKDNKPTESCNDLAAEVFPALQFPNSASKRCKDWTWGNGCWQYWRTKEPEKRCKAQELWYCPASKKCAQTASGCRGAAAGGVERKLRTNLSHDVEDVQQLRDFRIWPVAASKKEKFQCLEPYMPKTIEMPTTRFAIEDAGAGFQALGMTVTGALHTVAGTLVDVDPAVVLFSLPDAAVPPNFCANFITPIAAFHANKEHAYVGAVKLCGQGRATLFKPEFNRAAPWTLSLSGIKYVPFEVESTKKLPGTVTRYKLSEGKWASQGIWTDAEGSFAYYHVLNMNVVKSIDSDIDGVGEDSTETSMHKLCVFGGTVTAAWPLSHTATPIAAVEAECVQNYLREGFRVPAYVTIDGKPQFADGNSVPFQLVLTGNDKTHLSLWASSKVEGRKIEVSLDGVVLGTGKLPAQCGAPREGTGQLGEDVHQSTPTESFPPPVVHDIDKPHADVARDINHDAQGSYVAELGNVVSTLSSTLDDSHSEAHASTLDYSTVELGESDNVQSLDLGNAMDVTNTPLGSAPNPHDEPLAGAAKDNSPVSMAQPHATLEEVVDASFKMLHQLEVQRGDMAASRHTFDAYKTKMHSLNMQEKLETLRKLIKAARRTAQEAAESAHKAVVKATSKAENAKTSVAQAKAVLQKATEQNNKVQHEEAAATQASFEAHKQVTKQTQAVLTAPDDKTEEEAKTGKQTALAKEVAADAEKTRMLPEEKASTASVAYADAKLKEQVSRQKQAEAEGHKADLARKQAEAEDKALNNMLCLEKDKLDDAHTKEKNSKLHAMSQMVQASKVEAQNAEAAQKSASSAAEREAATVKAEAAQKRVKEASAKQSAADTAEELEIKLAEMKAGKMTAEQMELQAKATAKEKHTKVQATKDEVLIAKREAENAEAAQKAAKSAADKQAAAMGQETAQMKVKEASAKERAAADAEELQSKLAVMRAGNENAKQSEAESKLHAQGEKKEAKSKLEASNKLVEVARQEAKNAEASQKHAKSAAEKQAATMQAEVAEKKVSEAAEKERAAEESKELQAKLVDTKLGLNVSMATSNEKDTKFRILNDKMQQQQLQPQQSQSTARVMKFGITGCNLEYNAVNITQPGFAKQSILNESNVIIMGSEMELRTCLLRGVARFTATKEENGDVVAIAHMNPNFRDPETKMPFCFPMSTMLFTAGVVKDTDSEIERVVVLQLEPHGRLVIKDESRDIIVRLDNIMYHPLVVFNKAPDVCVPYCFPTGMYPSSAPMGMSGCVKYCTPTQNIRGRDYKMTTNTCKCTMLKRLDCFLHAEDPDIKCGQYKQLMSMKNSAPGGEDDDCAAVCGGQLAAF